MRNLIFVLSAVLFLAFTSCNKNDAPDEMVGGDDTENPENNACTANVFGIQIATPSINFNQDSSWLTYLRPGTGPVIIVGDRKGWLGWDFPTFPGTNDIVFDYPNAGLTVGKFDISSIGGVIAHDTANNTGTSLTCPCTDAFVEITQIDEAARICCGNIGGTVSDGYGNSFPIFGSFKAYLDY